MELVSLFVNCAVMVGCRSWASFASSGREICLSCALGRN
jgi:hypothetical protein